jgi:hypothetical protein
MYEWFINDWVHLVAVEPDTNRFYYFKDGDFTEYIPLAQEPALLKDVHALFESAKKMETNQTADASREHLPIHLLN